MPGYNCVHQGLSILEQKEVFLKTEPGALHMAFSDQETSGTPSTSPITCLGGFLGAFCYRKGKTIAPK